MKKVSFSNLGFIILFAILFVIITQGLNCQQTGKFDRTITQGSFSGQVSFFIPTTGAPTKGFPLIIGLHPAQTPGSAMRDMMFEASEMIGAILACPEGPDGDGSAILPIIEWVKKTYKTDETKIILTGYSAGGYPTFQVGLQNASKFKGLIGIAPSVSTYGMDISAVSQVPIAIIVGKNDNMYNGLKTFINTVNQNGGITKFVEKPGVGHTGMYFWSPEFSNDWKSCYEFCISSVTKPAKAILAKPANGAKEQPEQLDFSWEKINNATSYKIEINSPDGLFKSDNVIESSYYVSNLQKNTQYTWRVCGVNESGDGPWSDSWTFSTKSVPPDIKPTLQEPLNNAEIIAPDLKFKWQTIKNASKYHIQLYDNLTNKLIVEDSNITTSSIYAQYNVSILKAGNEYRWQVRGLNAAGKGPWSDEWKFTTLPDPPSSKAVLLKPKDNSTEQPLKISFEWETVKGADNYHLQIKNKKDNSILFNDSTILHESGATVKIEVDGFKPENTYSWKIRSSNKGGNGLWSLEYNLTTISISSVDDNTGLFSSLKLYPNPSDGIVMIEIPEAIDSEIIVYNSLGEIFSASYIKHYDFGTNKLTINLSDKPSGIYYIKISSNNNSVIKPILLMK